jgi:hypothetical protein
VGVAPYESKRIKKVPPVIPMSPKFLRNLMHTTPTMNPFEPHTGNASEATPRNTKKQEKTPQVVLFMSHLIIILLQSDALLKKLFDVAFTHIYITMKRYLSIT